MVQGFFIWENGDRCPAAVLLTTGMANLFGIGGASLISRCLGSGDEEKARKTSAFCIWSAGLAAFFYGIIMMIFKPYILPAVGTDQNTFGFCYQYLFWTITIGAVPTVLSAALSHLVRAEGYSAQASFGVALGGVLNIIFDPVFITTFTVSRIEYHNHTHISTKFSLNFFLPSLRLAPLDYGKTCACLFRDITHVQYHFPKVRSGSYSIVITSSNT